MKPWIPMNTPWGEVQDIEWMIPGRLCLVSTSSHGGFYVDPRIKDRMTRWPSPFLGNEWFEEDCDAAYVIVSFPELFGPESVERARASIILWEAKNKERSAA